MQGFNGLATSLSTGTTTITATLGLISGGTTLTVNSATLNSIQVTPTNPSVALGTTRQFTATGIYSDTTTQDLTAAVTWSSSNTGVALISNAPGSSGLTTGIATGAATITATINGISGNTTLTVTSAVLQAIDVSPTIPSIQHGTSQQFIATGTYSDNTTADVTAYVTWSSSNTGVATISNAPGSNGLAASVAAGTTTITAALSGFSGGTTLTVTAPTLNSIQITPLNPSISIDLNEQFYATGSYSDGSSADLTQAVTWSSSNTAVVTVSNAAGSNGLVTPVSASTATITAAFGGTSGTSTVTVNPATLVSIAISSSTGTIVVGTTEQFTAIGTFSDTSTQDMTASVLWTSSNTAIATISNTGGTNGLATAVGAGATTITAAFGSVTHTATLAVTAPTLNTITITPANASFAPGGTVQYTATGNYSDGTSQNITASVTWKTASKAIATVSNTGATKGQVTLVAVGSTTISATMAGTAVTGSTPVTVSSSITLTSISLTAASSHLAIGSTLQFTATGHYSDSSTTDLTKTATWSSSNTAVATIKNAPAKSKGLATGKGNGTATISAVASGITGTTTLTVP